MHPEIVMNLLNVLIMANVLLYHSVQSLRQQRLLTTIIARTGYAIKGHGIFLSRDGPRQNEYLNDGGTSLKRYQCNMCGKDFDEFDEQNAFGIHRQA